MDGCLVCAQVAGPDALPGGHLWADEHVVGFHVPPTADAPRRYRGHLLVVVRRHVDHLGDLEDEEAVSVARASRVLAAALRRAGAERVHLAVIGTAWPHFHQHLFPRYPGVPRGADWTRLDQLPGAPHLDAEGIEELAAQLRG